MAAGNNENTRLLLHFDGGLVDSALGAGAKTLTLAGGSLSTAERKFDDYSLACSPYGPNLIAGASADWDLEEDDWSLDAWVMITDTGHPYVFGWYVDEDNFFAIERVSTLGDTHAFGFTLRLGGSNIAVGTGSTLIDMVDTWRHVCLSRSGATIRLFIDGDLHCSATLPTSIFPITMTLFPLHIGAGIDRSTHDLHHLAGYIDEVRLEFGTARTADFTPPLDAYQPEIEFVLSGSFEAVEMLEHVLSGEFEAGPMAIEWVLGGEFTSDMSLEFVLAGAFEAVETLEFVLSGEFEANQSNLEFILSGQFESREDLEYVLSGAFSSVDTDIEFVLSGEFEAHYEAEFVLSGEFVADFMAEFVLSGQFQAENTDQVGYELYHGLDAMPDFTAPPVATSATLSFDWVMGDDEGLHYLVTRERNSYGYLSQNITPTIIEIDSAGDEIMRAPSAPELFEVEAVAGAKVRVTANYRYLDDEDRLADLWLVYATNTGVNPDPDTDTPTEVAMVNINGTTYLDWTSGAFTAGQTIKVLVRTRRTTPARDSSNLTPVSTTAVSAGPAAPSLSAFHSVSGQEVIVS